MKRARRLYREWRAMRRSAGYGRIGAALIVAWTETGCRHEVLSRLADRAPHDWRWWRAVALGDLEVIRSPLTRTTVLRPWEEP